MKKSLAELFGKEVSTPPTPMEIVIKCPFLNDIECKKSSGIDDQRLRPSGACSHWFQCRYLQTENKWRPIIICPNRFFLNSYFHLWSLIKQMVPQIPKDLKLIPEVHHIDWVIYSKIKGILGAIEVQAMDTTGSYKPQLFYLRKIKDTSSAQYSNTVNANWANATYKRFYPQVLVTMATIEQFDAPIGLITQDIFKPYLKSVNRYPINEDKKPENPEVVWGFLTLNNIGTIEPLIETFEYFTRTSFRKALQEKISIPKEDIQLAIDRQISAGKVIDIIQ